MKKNIILFGMSIILGLSSCMSEEQRYARDYSSFAEDFLENYCTYTATDWDAALQNYEYMRQQYAYYMSDMAAEERQAIDSLNCKVNAVFIKHEADNAANQLNSLFNEAIGTINELMK